MLIRDFYQITEIVSEETNIVANIKLNVDHEVYIGHFPEQPVVPGVIQLQIIKEIIENSLNYKLFMGNISQVKYLVPIIPNRTPELFFNIAHKKTDDNNLKAIISIGFNEDIFTKAKIEFSFC